MIQITAQARSILRLSLEWFIRQEVLIETKVDFCMVASDHLPLQLPTLKMHSTKTTTCVDVKIQWLISEGIKWVTA